MLIRVFVAACGRRARILAAALLLPVALPTAAGALTLGVMGDSLSDEYAEDSYAYADNWVEQLVQYRGVDVGPTAPGTWGEPRRTGFEYNWARAGATSTTLLSQGQDTGLAAQVVPEGIEYAVLAIGANDFAPFGTAYGSIYSGTWNATQIQSYTAQVLANIEAAMATATATGTSLVLATVPDYGAAPLTQTYFPNPIERALVTDVITSLNWQLFDLADQYNVVLVDLFGIATALIGSPSIQIGNVAIPVTSAGVAGTNAFVHDNIHPHTHVQGVLANLMMSGLNAYGAGLTLFSEQELLAHAGVAYGGSDTLAAQIGSYDSYVYSYVPEPGTVVLLALGVSLLAMRGRRARS